MAEPSSMLGTVPAAASSVLSDVADDFAPLVRMKYLFLTANGFGPLPRVRIDVWASATEPALHTWGDDIVAPLLKKHGIAGGLLHLAAVEGRLLRSERKRYAINDGK